MKKVASIAAIALFAIGFTSCKKDYTCVCSINGTEVSRTTINDTKSNAKSACEQTTSAGGVTASCVIAD